MQGNTIKLNRWYKLNETAPKEYANFDTNATKKIIENKEEKVMEEKQRKELIKKIIEEQDIVALYTYDGFNKSLGIMQEYSKGILYSGLKKFILQNSEMLKKFTTKNLYTLLASTYDESEKQMINE